jgi:hypothetical protein
MARCGSIATAMTARGFVGPETHALHLGGKGELGPARRRRAADGLLADVGLMASLAGLAAASWALP